MVKYERPFIIDIISICICIFVMLTILVFFYKEYKTYQISYKKIYDDEQKKVDVAKRYKTYPHCVNNGHRLEEERCGYLNCKKAEEDQHINPGENANNEALKELDIYKGLIFLANRSKFIIWLAEVMISASIVIFGYRLFLFFSRSVDSNLENLNKKKKI